MGEILTDLAAESLAAAVKDNLYTFFQSFGRCRQAELLRGPTALCWATLIPHPWFNGVLSTALPGRDGRTVIRDQIRYFEGRGTAMFTWWPDSRLDPAPWDRLLRAEGFRFDRNTPGMAVELDRLAQVFRPPPGLTIRPVEDEAGLAAWVRTFLEGYGLPDPWFDPFFDLLADLGWELALRHYLGYLAGKPVATTSLYYAAGVAGVYNVATLPAARGRGIGGYLTAYPLLEAREMGYRAAVLQSSDMGYGVYRNLGFVEVCRMEHYFWSARTAASR